MRTVTKEFYKEKLIECINTRYGGVNALKRGESMRDGELRKLMRKELTPICNPAPEEIRQFMHLIDTLYELCINEILSIV